MADSKMLPRAAMESALAAGLGRAEAIEQTVRESGCCVRWAQRIYSGLSGKVPPKPEPKKSVRTLKAETLIDAQRLDQAKIVRDALDQFDADDCAYDESLRRDLGISSDRWREVRDLDEFLEYQIVLPTKKRVWCLPKKRSELLKLDGVTEVS